MEESLPTMVGIADSVPLRDPADTSSTPAKLSPFGFYFAITASGALFLAATIYLFQFVAIASKNFGETRDSVIGGKDQFGSVVVAQMDSFWMGITLNSCGVFLGLALAFVGLALFLVGVKGSTDASGEGGGYKFHLVNLSPGLYVMTLSCLLVLACCVWRPPLNITANNTAPTSSSAAENPNPVLQTPSVVGSEPLTPEDPKAK